MIKITGTVFNIQKYSIHDGPGIRTTVFLKGCPLACLWCHNPESIAPRPEIIFWDNKCISCTDCVKTCPQEAMQVGQQTVRKETANCIGCEACVEVCPTGAIEQVGRKMTEAEVLKEIEKDRVFYEESGGGVTFSGGECLMQPEFLTALLTGCKARGLHTAVDTSGYASWQTIAELKDVVDLFLYDLKLMDEEQHRKYTGVSNKLILANLQKLAKLGKSIWIRVPVIPGINDNDDNLQAMGAFLFSLQIRDVFLLPYHGIAANKYIRLGRDYQLSALEPPSPKQMEAMQLGLRTFGLNVQIGG